MLDVIRKHPIYILNTVKFSLQYYILEAVGLMKQKIMLQDQ